MLELNKIYNMDCIEGMKQLDDNSVQLVIIDPPYFKIKDNDWDNQWNKFEEYLDWIENICLEIKRVLKENGSFYIFGDDERIAYIQIRLDKHFTFLNHLIWYKINNTALKWASNHRKFCPMSERILFYSVQKSKTGLKCIDEQYIKPQNPMSIYLSNEIKRSGRTRKEISALFPSRTGGLTGCISNWVNGDNFPLREQYLKIKEFLGNGFLEESYDVLRVQYKDLREQYEDLRRPFNYQYNIHEVITEPIIQSKENTNHPTTKPIRLIKKLISASSNEDDVIFDCFMGSGTTAIASRLLNRRYVGFEIDKKYCDIANKRLNNIPKKLENWIDI